VDCCVPLGKSWNDCGLIETAGRTAGGAMMKERLPPIEPLRAEVILAACTVKARVRFPAYPFRLGIVSVELALDPVGATTIMGFPVRP